MSTEETAQTFPLGDPQGLEPKSFEGLLRSSIVGYLSLLKETEPPTRPQTIYQLEDGRISSQQIAFPFYPLASDKEKAKEALSSGEIRKLLDYAWERGELQHGLTGPNPQRNSWEFIVLRDVIHAPLSRILTEAAFDEAVDEGQVTLWAVPERLINKAVGELVLRYCHGRYRYKARCPLAWVSGEAGKRWSLGEDLDLCLYTPRERTGYLSRHHGEFLWQDTLSQLIQMDVAVLEVVLAVDLTFPRLGVPGTGLHYLEQQIADRIDLVKWALMATLDKSDSLIEGTVSYEHMLGGQLTPIGLNFFRREVQKDEGPVYKMTDDAARQAKSLIGQAIGLREKSPDLQQAFWYWGRSCLASIDRDVLLDAVIGLEGLLVPTAGEIRYRFGLHGAALLASCSDDAETMARELRKIYDKRSSAAHGRKEDRLEEASRARHYLGDVISAVITLIKGGMIDPSSRISEQIQTQVLRRCQLMSH